MAEKLETPKIQSLEIAKGAFQLENWERDHDMYAALKTGCVVEIGNPKIPIRFYLKPVEKWMTIHHSGSTNHTERRWIYNLQADVLKTGRNLAVRVTATESVENTTKSAALADVKGNAIQVIDEFLHMRTDSLYPGNSAFAPIYKGKALTAKSLEVTISLELFGVTAPNGLDKSEEAKQAFEAEESLLTDLKGLYATEDIYPDLKIEASDGITLDAHKFLVAARSSYLREKLEGAIKNNDFDEVLPVSEANGKTMKVILHWMYTGELHETAAAVMEDIAEAAILFQLNQLLKALDKQLISICTKQNMFRLYTVAQKTAMPNASAEISAFIKDNI